jgi:16S rRNA (guanine966-N2)-methyltransferase
MKQGIKIIAGQYRGKKILVPDIENLRPSPARVRETLFNWLQQSIQNARCLDAYAGSGILGFEAYSRGALEVTMIEKVPEVYQHLKKTAAAFKQANINIIKNDCLNFLKDCTKQFDIIFLDPPYQSQLLQETMQYLSQSNHLAESGIVYAESDKPLHFDGHWQCIKSKKAATVYYGLFQK